MIKTRGQTSARLLLMEQCASHGPEFFRLFFQDLHFNMKMIRQAGITEKRFRAAVDHLPRHSDLILYQDRATAAAANRMTHGEGTREQRYSFMS